MARIFRALTIAIGSSAVLVGTPGRIAAQPTTHTLVVNSSTRDGSHGFFVSVSPPDIGGRSDGQTAFIRTYSEGATVVLEAQDRSGVGRRFAGWWVDRVRVTPSRTLVLEMDAPHVAEARYEHPRTLIVNSAGVADVTIWASPEPGGTPPFERSYLDGTLVTLAAPDAPAGASWQGWELDGVLQPPGDDPMSIAFAMDTDRDACARYLPPQPITMHRLLVNSEGRQVNVTVSPPDAGGYGNDHTSFSRTYVAGTTVTLTAPDQASYGYRWAGWYVSGTLAAEGRTLDLVVDANKTATARYLADPVVLTVNSEGLYGAHVSLSPSDIAGRSGGPTPFQATYPLNTPITLQASPPPPGYSFVEWLVDGVSVLPPDLLELTVTPDRHQSVSACYHSADLVVARRLVVSSEGATAWISVDTPDLEGLQEGSTSFVRTYADGECIRLTAPDLTSSGHRFIEWRVDGAYASDTRALDLCMTANHTAAACYIRPRTLTVNSNGILAQEVEIVSPDPGTDTTPFQRDYVDGASVTLYAPGAPEGFTFVGWLVGGQLVPPEPDPMMVTVTMDRDQTAAACYEEAVGPACTLTVNAGGLQPAHIQVDPPDRFGAHNGYTGFQRSYNYGTDVTIEAQAWGSDGRPGACIFWRWEVDGRWQTEWLRTLSLSMTEHRTATAWYVRSQRLSINSAGVKGAYVEAWPPDWFGNSSDTTPFELWYQDGEEVDLFAYDLGGHAFDYWQVGDLILPPGEDAHVIMDADIGVIAHYLQPDWYDAKRLIVNTAGCIDIWIDVAPEDLDWVADGRSSFLRLYQDGELVHVSAPGEVYQSYTWHDFRHWTVDGVAQPEGVTDVTVLMDDHHALTAYYSRPWTLRVNSDGVTSAPIDVFPGPGGDTDFDRVYPDGTLVTLLATEVPGHPFHHWELDGAAHPVGQTELTLVMDSYHTATAHYDQPDSYVTNELIVNSAGALSVPIGVSPPDLNAHSDGDTQFQRIYEQGEAVELSAPSQAGYFTVASVFRHWTVDGQVASPGVGDVTLAMDSSVTATAWYEPYRVLTVNAAGVELCNAPVDLNPAPIMGVNEYVTPYRCYYLHDTLVTLAAGDVPGHVFTRLEVDDHLLPVGVRECQVRMDEHHTVTAWYDMWYEMSVEVGSPNGGEVLTCGSPESVEWHASGGTPPFSVELRYSTNGGASYDFFLADVLQLTVGAEAHVWPVPNVDSTAVRVQVCATDSSDPPITVCDSSDADLTILPCGARTMYAADGSGVPGAEALVSIMIDESAEVCGAQAVLTFDASVLEVERVVGPEGWGASFATSAPGEATLIAWSPSAQPLPGGAATIWDVQVRVLGGVGNYSDLCLSDVTVSDEDGEPLTVIPGPCGSFTVTPEAAGFAIDVAPAECQHMGASAADPMPFALTVTAVDAIGDPMTSYSGLVDLSSCGADLDPQQVELVAGVWSDVGSLPHDLVGDCSIYATDGVGSGDSRVMSWRGKGDPDGSGVTNVFDVMRAVNLSLGLAPPEPPCGDYQAWSADIPDGTCTVDGVVNILDVMRIVNQALRRDPLCPAGGPLSAAAAVVPDYAPAPVEVLLQRDGRGAWAVHVSNASDVAAVQLDIRVAKAEMAAGELIAKLGWQTRTSSARARRRVLAFSPEARPLDVDGGVALRLSGVRGKPRLENVVVSDAAGRELPVHVSQPRK